MTSIAICFTLKLQPLINHNISEYVGEAIDIANRLQMPIEFESEGRRVVVWPSDGADEILALWHAGHAFVCQHPTHSIR